MAPRSYDPMLGNEHHEASEDAEHQQAHRLAGSFGPYAYAIAIAEGPDTLRLPAAKFFLGRGRLDRALVIYMVQQMLLQGGPDVREALVELLGAGSRQTMTVFNADGTSGPKPIDEVQSFQDRGYTVTKLDNGVVVEMRHGAPAAPGSALAPTSVAVPATPLAIATDPDASFPLYNAFGRPTTNMVKVSDALAAKMTPIMDGTTLKGYRPKK